MWKLIGGVEAVAEPSSQHHWRAYVEPQMLPADNPLAAITGATNAVCYSTELLGDITLSGPGAGRLETGYAVIEDILSIRNLL